MKYYRYSFICLAFSMAATVLSIGCTAQPKNKSKFPYDLNNPKVIELTDELAEISAVISNDSAKTLYGISDDEGYLFEIPVGKNDKIKRWEFNESKDFEALVSVGAMFYILDSDGDVYETSFDNGVLKAAERYKFPYERNNEFEAMYYDSSARRLVILCKNCKDDKAKELSCYSFDLEKKTYKKGPYTINVDMVAHMLDEKKMNLKPSAVTVSPKTKELYILSSINKLLLIADMNGKVHEVHELDRNIFKQPEGICFMPDGTLVISNEQAGKGHAELLLFKR